MSSNNLDNLSVLLENNNILHKNFQIRLSTEDIESLANGEILNYAGYYICFFNNHLTLFNKSFFSKPDISVLFNHSKLLKVNRDNLAVFQLSKENIPEKLLIGEYKFSDDVIIDKQTLFFLIRNSPAKKYINFRYKNVEKNAFASFESDKDNFGTLNLKFY